MSRSELNRIIQGDALESLKLLSAESIDCCVTSPPYYGLRDYGIGGQIGLEASPEEYVTKLVTVFREVRRVLKREGTLWLNLGDSYANAKGGFRAGRNAVVGNTKAGEQRGLTEIPNGYKIKDLLGVPWMVAFALRADGWYLRSDIIWQKPNAMPESVTDRPTKSHEYLFLLSKSQRYYYDAEAIKEANVTNQSLPDLKRHWSERPNNGAISGKGGYRMGSIHNGRNKRTVWTIPTKPYKGAHFATFPVGLVEPCILAGTSEKGYCPECGKPWVRQIEKINSTRTFPDNGKGIDERKADGTNLRAGECRTNTIGWGPSCDHVLDPCADLCTTKSLIPGVVLDPFFGAGTTGLVAKKLGRSFIGIELNPKYAELSRKRIASAYPLSSFIAEAV